MTQGPKVRSRRKVKLMETFFVVGQGLGALGIVAGFYLLRRQKSWRKPGSAVFIIGAVLDLSFAIPNFINSV